MKINDITKYKKAKLLTKDLEKLIVILKQTKKDLAPYKKYYGMSDLLINIIDSQIYFQIHLDEQRSILNCKGEIDEN